jgi:hypothetical protein
MNSDSLNHISDSLTNISLRAELNLLNEKYNHIESLTTSTFNIVIGILALFCTIVLGFMIFNWFRQSKIDREKISNALLELRTQNSKAINELINNSGLQGVASKLTSIEKKVLYTELLRSANHIKGLNLEIIIDNTDEYISTLNLAFELYKRDKWNDYDVKKILAHLKEYLEGNVEMYHTKKDELMKRMQMEDLKPFETYINDIMPLLQKVKTY